MPTGLPGRPIILRDPVHGDIVFPRNVFGHFVLEILTTRTYQRLRGIRQNGVMNLVFHGAEHSRFSHSVGAAHIAAQMYDAAVHNSLLESDEGARQDTILATLLHDVGHGPFSHTLEEILKQLNASKFDHEHMTVRLLTEKDSELNQRLTAFDKDLPSRLAPYIDKKKRKTEAWNYAIVSSQLDADKLDYLARDSLMTGIHHSFDHKRLIQSLGVAGHTLVVDHRAADVIESYILALDQMYAAGYFHKTVRAASSTLGLAIRRAITLARESTAAQQSLFPAINGHPDPFWQLVQDGDNIALPIYASLDEHHVWSLIARWTTHNDATLSDLTNRLLTRQFLKPMDLRNQPATKVVELVDLAKKLTAQHLTHLDPDYYVDLDAPERVSYKRPTGEGSSGAIKLIYADGKVRSADENPRSITRTIAERQIYYPRLIVHEDIRDTISNILTK